MPAQADEHAEEALTRAEQDALITEHLPIVGYAVSETIRKVPSHVERDELAACASVALVVAARSFDPSRGVPFGRYASLRIRGAIVDELRSLDWASRHTRAVLREVDRTTQALTSELRRGPTDSEVAEAMGTDVARVSTARGYAMRRPVSMDASPDVSAALRAPELSPETALLVRERLEILAAAVAELPDRLRHVVTALFYQSASGAQVAAQMGVSVSRVSQLRTEAMGLLRGAVDAALDPRPPQAGAGVAQRRRLAYYSAVAKRASARSQPASVHAG